MLGHIGRYILSAALVLLSRDAFRQAIGEFGDSEPGSMLFGALQLVMGVSAAMASFGVFRRARWAAGAVGSWGIAAVALLLSQPLFDPMDPDALQGLGLGAAVVGSAAAVAVWFARRLTNPSATSHTSKRPVQQSQASSAPLPDAGPPADPLLPPVPITYVARAEPSARQNAVLPNPGTSTPE